MNVKAANSRMFASLGLGLLPNDAGVAGRATVQSVLGVTLFIVMLDAFVFRRHLDASYVSFYTGELRGRMLRQLYT